MPTDDIKMFDQMKLATLIGMFAGQDSQRHTLEVSLGAIRAWHSEAERLRADNARLRAALKPFADSVTVTEGDGETYYTVPSDRRRPPVTDIMRARRVYDESMRGLQQTAPTEKP